MNRKWIAQYYQQPTSDSPRPLIAVQAQGTKQRSKMVKHWGKRGEQGRMGGGGLPGAPNILTSPQRRTDRQTNRQTERERERDRERQTDRQIDRQRERQTHTHRERGGRGERQRREYTQLRSAKESLHTRPTHDVAAVQPVLPALAHQQNPPDMYSEPQAPCQRGCQPFQSLPPSPFLSMGAWPAPSYSEARNSRAHVHRALWRPWEQSAAGTRSPH